MINLKKGSGGLKVPRCGKEDISKGRVPFAFVLKLYKKKGERQRDE